MNNDIELKATDLVADIISDMGYELVETEYKKIYGNPTLTFYIYKKGGITLEDCEKVSNAIDPILENNDISYGAFYHLNVSSLGLDRPILTNDDYRRNLGEDIEVLFDENSKKKKTHGILISYNDDEIVIEEKGKQVTYERINLSTVRPYIKF